MSLEEIREAMNAAAHNFGTVRTIADNDLQRAYFRKLNSGEDNSLGAILNRVEAKEAKTHKRVQQEVDYDFARTVLWKIFSTKLEAQNRKFKMEGNDMWVIQNLLKYFIGDDSSEFDLQKGICLMGSVGPGKTFLLESFGRLASELKLAKAFKMVSTSDIYDRVAASQNKTVTMSRYYKGNVCFDDLGDEPLIYKDFGNDLAYVIRIFTKRYEAFSRGKIFTFATSNLEPKDLQERYGERFYDRFKQMFNAVVLTAPTKRK